MSFSPPRAPLARSTLIHMGARIGVIVALTTLFSYLHILNTQRGEARVRLERYISEHSQREQAIFLLAEDNQAILKSALVERLSTRPSEDVSARFDRLFVSLPDGTVRNRAERFDGTREPGVLVPRGVQLNADLRRRILAAYDVVAQFGPAFHTRVTNTYITLPEGPLIIYWPEQPTFSLTSKPDFWSPQYEFFKVSRPENNPERKTAWTGAYFDPISQEAMVSVSTPLDQEQRHLATISQDVLLAEMLDRIQKDTMPGAYNLVFRDDGLLIAHPKLTPNDLKGDHNILDLAKRPEEETPWAGSEKQRAHLRDIFEQVKNRPPGESVVELPEHKEFLAMGQFRGPNWNFVTIFPERLVTKPAAQAARYVLLLGSLSLLLELVMMHWVLKQQIALPLQSFTHATDRVASGDFNVELDTTRQDELGQLARAFRLMADKVQRREEELRQTNESLEQRVEERTRELRDIHHQLVQTARRAGMAEIATNVLHNVGNVLTSVYTSAQLAKERMGDMRLDHVGRVASLLQENQGDLTTFLTQDERGRHVLPFLGKLGQNLVDDREEIVSLLDDVGRYTEHIGDIVKVQQNFARTPRVHEPVQLAELVEDALRINSAGLARHQVTVERNLEPLPPVPTDKHKTLMILVNLVSNAQYALDGVAPDKRRLTVRLKRAGADRVHIEVHDNGKGIEPEMLTRIFQYGFTTREDGHGFGLHSSALAAQELGGALTAHSDGPGRGATFTLALPYFAAQEAA
ncbi:sensor histidine kinase [Archangium violaceum]|uniref:sensor histidine kinase n=1 Tax=Archangium violaceum TaxID=83451 RepID=UPI0037C0DE77